MENTDLRHVRPHFRPTERLLEIAPQERRRQEPVEGSMEEAQGQVSPLAPPEMDKLREAAQKVSAMLRGNEIENPRDPLLSFSVDEDTKEVVVRLVDRESEEVIRQFPTDVSLQNMAAMRRVKGMLFEQRGLLLDQRA